MDKINLFKKSTKLPARILVPKSSKCILSFHKCVLEILSLEIKPNPFNKHYSLKLPFTCRIRRVNAMFFLGKIDDITTRLIQDLSMLIISPVSFSVFILSFVWLFISLEPIRSKATSGLSSWRVGRINWSNLLDVASRKTVRYVFSLLTDFWKIFPFYSI